MQTKSKLVQIVIADDSEALRKRLHLMLEKQDDFRLVGEAESAEDAIALIQKFQPTVVLLDIQMPGNGITALKTVKKKWPHIRVVMLTNHADSFFRRISLSAGADAFLDKSLEFEKVPSTIRKLAS